MKIEQLNKLKAAAATISVNCEYDEGVANAALADVRKTLIEALGGDLEMTQARVLCDSGDAYTYLVLDIPAGTNPEDAYDTLMNLYYKSGDFGPDSWILSVRGITHEGKFWEIPFRGATPLKRVNFWLSTKVDHGAEALWSGSVWTDKSMNIIDNMSRETV